MDERSWSPEQPHPNRFEVLQKADRILHDFNLNLREVQGKKLLVSLSDVDKDALVAAEGEKGFYIKSYSKSDIEDEFDFFLDDTADGTCDTNRVHLYIPSLQNLKAGGQYRGSLGLTYAMLVDYSGGEKPTSETLENLKESIKKELLENVVPNSDVTIFIEGVEDGKFIEPGKHASIKIFITKKHNGT